MSIGARLPLIGILPLLLSLGCERPEVRRAREVVGLVQTMGTELRSVSANAAVAFTGRADFEELRRAFGDESFDAGIPLGRDFQGSLSSMLRDLELQLEKEPKDAGFPRSAFRRVRHFSQWWASIRMQLEARRGRWAQSSTQDTEALRLLGGRVRREDVLAVLTETIRVIGTFEAITARYVRRIEDIIILS